MAFWWQWLADSSQQLTLLITAAGVIVAAVYVVLTHTLAAAAKQQAKITQQTFEATNRPWLSINLMHSWDHDDLRFTATLENHGPVPAVLVEWIFTLRQDGSVVGGGTPLAAPALAISVFQSATHPIGDFKIGGAPVKACTAGRTIEIEASIRYRGVGDTVYRTSILYDLVTTPGASRWACLKVEQA